MDCVSKTIRKEGLRGFYKGASPPLVGWMITDSIMLGSLTTYRHWIKDTLYSDRETLPLPGVCLAGILSGWTVSFVAAPIEQIKSRLQIQRADPATKLYTGPIDCATSIVRNHGVSSLFRGLLPSMIFRSNFMFLWGSYDLLTRYLERNFRSSNNGAQMSKFAVNFWAGGLSAAIFWCFAYPADVVKQKIMTDDFSNPRFNKSFSWISGCKSVYREQGIHGFFRGFTPTLLRSFPANASALATFELVMRFFNWK